VTSLLSLDIDVQRQPDNTTCGPTCLHAVYQYYGDTLDLAAVIGEVPTLPTGGTLAVHLANHALSRGYHATLFTYNLTLFDPTWFAPGAPPIVDRLAAQRQAKADPKLALATDAYLEFVALGGRVRLEDLTADLLETYLRRGAPLLTGLSATYLYRCARERDDRYDDTGGEPTGHFVVISGYDAARREVLVRDPLHDHPGQWGSAYRVALERLTAAIMLGIVTYDANVLVLEPRDSKDTG